jgi:hypothetical protein
MSANYYDLGFSAGKTGCVGRPPYDPRDPLTMKWVMEYNAGHDAGRKARFLESTSPNMQVAPRLSRKGRSL